MKTPGGTSAEGVAAFLVVRAEALRCAIPLENVRHVARSMTLWPVPGSAPELVGLGQFGGEPVVVLDLLRLVEKDRGLGETDSIVVVVSASSGTDGEEIVGLAASEALDIVRVPRQAVSAGGRGFASADLLVGENLVRIVDPRALVAS